MDRKRLKGNVILLCTAMIWGATFVAQKSGMDTVGPFMFNCIRMFLGAAVLMPVIIIGELKRKKSGQPAAGDSRKDVIAGGLATGVVYFFAANLQQVGLVSVDAGKTAFITALYILLVPLLGVFLKHKVTKQNWIGAVIGTAGLYLLCITDGFSIAKGDFIVLIGALFWAIHILVVDHFTVSVSSAKLIAGQSLVAGVMSLTVSLLTETNTWAGIIENAPSLLYAGILASGIAYTLQAEGQKFANPSTASIILSTESLFGAVSGFLFLHEVMTGRELTGCVLMLAAIIVSQIPSRRRDKYMR